MVDDPQPSARVEIEETTRPGPDVPESFEASSGRRPQALVFGLVSIVALVAMLVMLRPNDGETAAGTVRQTTTTTMQAETATELDGIASTSVVVNTSSTPSTSSGGAIDPSPFGTGERLDGVTSGLAGQFPDSVTRAGDGYLMLTTGARRSVAPLLFRSVDGLTWTPVDVEAPPSEIALGDVVFSHLISTEDGVALLRTIHSPIGGSVVDRLISTDGTFWTIDPSFDAIQSPRVMRVQFHGRSTVAVFKELEPCFDVSPDDSLGVAAIIRFPSGQERQVAPNPFLADAVELPDGRLAMVDPGDAFGFDFLGAGLRGCENTAEVPEVMPPAIDVWELDGSVVRLELWLEGRWNGFVEGNYTTSTGVGPDGLRVIHGPAVFKVDVETDTWTGVLDLPILKKPSQFALFTDTGDVLLLGPEVRFGDVDSGRWTTIDTASTSPWVVYADSDIALVINHQAFVEMIDLSAAQ